jgi:hypothetical protein
MQVLPNTGILGNDSLDRLRGDALTACDDGLPEPLVYYLRAIEAAYLDMKAEQKRRSIREIGWKFTTRKPDSAEEPR